MLESGDPSTEQWTTVEREPIPSDFVNYVGHAQSLNNAERLSALQDHFKPDKPYHFPTHTEYKNNTRSDTVGLNNITGWFIHRQKMEHTVRYVFFLGVIEVTRMHPNLAN